MHRSVRAVGIRDIGDKSWALLQRGADVHTALYRASRGLIGHRVPGLPQMLLLDHVGARSGRKRTTPLVYARDGDDLRPTELEPVVFVPLIGRYGLRD